jgi:uncharacterized coiled-coil protein SlyX
MSELENRIVNLEAIVSYQDQMLEDLNAVVIAQQKSLDGLLRELQKVKESLVPMDHEPDNRRPPHY